MPTTSIISTRATCRRISDLVPAIVLDLHHPILDANWKRGSRLISRRGQSCARAHVEGSTVARAGDDATAHGAAGEDAAIVGADILDGVEFPLDIENGDHDVVHVRHLMGTGRDLVHPGYIDPISHPPPLQ